MSRETKVGILAVVALFILFAGYQYLKGIDVFAGSNLLMVEYDDVEMLNASDPVILNGVQVGIVQDVQLNPNQDKVTVALNINENLKVPKGSKATIISTGIMGSMGVELKLNGACNDDCAGVGDKLVGRTQGLIESFLGGESDTEDGSNVSIQSSMGPFIDTVASRLSNPNANHNIAESFKRLHGALANLEKTTEKLDRLMGSSSTNLNGTLSNVESLTSNLKQNNDKISKIVSNFEGFSNNLKDTDLEGTMEAAKEMLKTTDQSVRGLQTTLDKANESFSNMNDLLSRINSQDGSLGQLLNDKELYNNMAQTTKNLNLLLQDFRLNPKRYVNVSVFGKKQKSYQLPESDPAEKE